MFYLVDPRQLITPEMYLVSREVFKAHKEKDNRATVAALDLLGAMANRAGKGYFPLTNAIAREALNLARSDLKAEQSA